MFYAFVLGRIVEVLYNTVGGPLILDKAPFYPKLFLSERHFLCNLISLLCKANLAVNSMHWFWLEDFLTLAITLENKLYNKYFQGLKFWSSTGTKK